LYVLIILVLNAEENPFGSQFVSKSIVNGLNLLFNHPGGLVAIFKSKLEKKFGNYFLDIVYIALCILAKYF
jgi:hypothetical protein